MLGIRNFKPYQLLIAMVLFSDHCLAETPAFVELEPNQMNFSFNLSHIFVEKKDRFVKNKASLNAESAKQTDVALVGTLIKGQQKLAWIKLGELVYQLENGQSIPGTAAIIMEIKPGFVIAQKNADCFEASACHWVMNIHQPLF